MAVAQPPFDFEDDAPQVGSPDRPWVVPLGLAFSVALGGAVFWQLQAKGGEASAPAPATPATEPLLTAAAPYVAAYQAPLPMPAPEEAAPAMLPIADQEPTMEDVTRLKSPALIVDLSEAQPTTAAPTAGEAAIANLRPQSISDAAAGRKGALGAQAATASRDEQFAERLGIANAADNAPARAQMLMNQESVIVQGAVLPAVLETAINSDLPGYARAVVSRDVRSFDGSQVLVPRGSRLVGQYRSGVALGQSRAFVIWSRLIRPDGVNIDLASPGTDALGRGGLEGRVDTHFLRRFGGAILLSLINAGVEAAGSESDTQVIIASTQGATNSAAAVALSKELDIAPTVDVAQGTPIRIFVARDLDFSDMPAVTPEGD